MGYSSISESIPGQQLMRRRGKYRVRIYDEAHLVDKGGFSVNWLKVVLASLVALVVMVSLGIVVVTFTPVNRLLPGYMKTEQRLRTESACLRVDSLEELYILHQAYLDNLIKVLDTDRQPDIPDTVGPALPLIPDSLMVSSEIEREFMKKMEEAGYIITINQEYEDTVQH